MAEFSSYKGYRDFAYAVLRHRRYVRTPEQLDFLRSVLDTSKSRQEILPSGAKLWRAQLGHRWCPVNVGGELTEEFPAPFDPARMKPLTDRAREGRANPTGIPFLYLATHQQTAAAEVRPWIGSYVSIARFHLVRDARVVNCTTADHRVMVYLSEPEPEDREQAVWRDIGRAFSEPVTSDDDSAAYSPTQVVAEFFQDNDIDGIAYGSSLGPGHNVVLFDPNAAALENCGLVKVRAVTLDLSPEGDTYLVSKHIP